MSRLASTFVALVLVVATVGGAFGPSPVGTADALDYEECAKDWLTGALVETVFDYIMGNPNHCLEISGSDHVNQSRTDLVASMKTVNSTSDDTLTALQNRLVDSRSVALTKAKITIVNELNNGSNRSVAKAEANETIEAYYTQIEGQLWTAWNKNLLQARYMADSEYQETGGRGSWIDLDVWDIDDDDWGDTYSWIEAEPREANVTLVDGSNMSTDYLGHYESEVSGADYSKHWVNHPNAAELDGFNESYLHSQVNWGGNYAYDSAGHIWVSSDGVNQSVAIDFSRYSATEAEIDSQAQQSKANVGAYVDGIFGQYSAGELNTTDLLSPTELYQEASTSKNSTGYYGWASVQLASLGYSGDVETSHLIEVNGTNRSGTLFYTAGDLSTISTGTTIDPTAYNGSFMFAEQVDANSSKIVELQQNFTVHSATDLSTGESLNATTMERKVYDSTTAADLAAELEALRELRQQYENTTTYMGGSGGTGGSGLGGTELAIVAGIAILAAAAYAMNGGTGATSGGRRRRR